MNESSLIIENLPMAYARHKVVTDARFNPIDFVFLKVNRAFEQMTGLGRENIIGKRVTKVLPGIARDPFHWIDVYGKIALNGQKYSFQQFSETLQRWYEVIAYSEKKGFFTTVFNDITERKKTDDSLRYQNDKMKLLLGVSQDMVAEKDTYTLGQTIVDGITKLTRLDTAAIYLLRNNMLYLEATYPPLPPDFPEYLRYAAIQDHPHVNKAIARKEPVVVTDSHKAKLTPAEQEVCALRKLRSILYIPLVYKGQSIGVLIPASIERVHEFTEDEISICKTLASHAALSVSEATLFERQKQYIAEIKEKNKSLEKAEHTMAQTLDRYRKVLAGMVHSMGTLMSKKDNYTAEHQVKVARLAVAIAEEMGMKKERVEGLRLAAMIHDLGKISIPAEILTKPGKLTELEFKILQTHPYTGFEILSNIEFPWPLAQIIIQHHEKIDGSGYPEGLSGSDILLEARILCVADVVEAMASHRPYRPALGIDVALEEISEKKGILFDHDVVEACVKLFREKGFTLE